MGPVGQALTAQVEGQRPSTRLFKRSASRGRQRNIVSVDLRFSHRFGPPRCLSWMNWRFTPVGAGITSAGLDQCHGRIVDATAPVPRHDVDRAQMAPRLTCDSRGSANEKHPAAEATEGVRTSYRAPSARGALYEALGEPHMGGRRQCTGNDKQPACRGSRGPSWSGHERMPSGFTRVNVSPGGLPDPHALMFISITSPDGQFRAVG